MKIGRFFKEVWRGYDKHQLSDLAAMLTYYAIFALFPFVLFLVTMTLLVLPKDVLEQAFRMLAFALPGTVSAFALEQLKHFESAAGGGFAAVGLLLAIWGASRGTAGLTTALNSIFEVRETRSWLRVQLICIATTLLAACLVLVAFALLIFGPMVGHFLMDRFWLGPVFDLAFSIGRWVGAALLILAVRGLLFYFLPNTPKRRFPLFTLGSLVGAALWLTASRGLVLYTDNFANYDKTYGTLGGVIVFLTWLWISCLMLLLAGEIDVAIDKLRHPPAEETAIAKETIVEREIQVTREPALSALVKRVGEDLSQLAKDHVELARNELATSAKKVLTDGAAVVFGGVVALIGLAMLCMTAVVAAAPLIPALWLRLLIGALVYMMIGGGLAVGFVHKLRGGPIGFTHTKREAERTVRALKAQVQNG